MSSTIPLLSNVKVAAPCSASWKDMDAVDGDRVHFCDGCKKNVYNLSAMTQTEGLLRKHEGHLCVRYYKRTDGTILTQNCPVGQAALRLKMIARSKRAALVTVAMASIVVLGDMRFASVSHVVMGGPVMLAGAKKSGTTKVADPAIASRAESPSVDRDRAFIGYYISEPVSKDKDSVREVMMLPTGPPDTNMIIHTNSKTGSPK